MAKSPVYLSGGAQTTLNSTITELFPALAFNNGVNPASADAMENFITGLNLKGKGSKKTFVNDSNLAAAQKFIGMLDQLRPSMKKEKLENACGITKYLYDLSAKRPISYVVWGYREKPKGVPPSHAGDIFIFFADNSSPSILGVSLKAGTESSKEPKMNSYVKTTLGKPMWQKSAPNALDELKVSLWNNVYSKIPKLPKTVTKSNFYTLSGAKSSLIPNQDLIKALINFYESNPERFDELYFVMNRLCREKLCEVINNDLKATKEWIRKEFRLETTGSSAVEVPLILVKAVGKDYINKEDELASFLRYATKVKAYLHKSSVQEWFIDLMDNKGNSITLSMTIRSDSGFRRDKPKGKLGTFVGLKLLYKGVEKKTKKPKGK